MPQIEARNIIRAKPGDVLIIDIQGPGQRSLVDEAIGVPDIQVQIGKHFMGTAEAFQHARSRQHNDLEALRTELDPGFKTLLPEIEKLGLTDREIRDAIKEAVFQDNVDPNEVDSVAREMGDTYLANLRAYQESILPLKIAS